MFNCWHHGRIVIMNHTSLLLVSVFNRFVECDYYLYLYCIVCMLFVSSPVCSVSLKCLERQSG